ncbi:heavy metal-responsive transcriptional regulator [Streptomyces sp. NPDC054796]
MRIGALAHAAGVSTKTIRCYEQAGLLPAPPRTPSGYRDYPPDAAERLALIRAAQTAGLTLAEVGRVLSLRDAGHVTCGHVAALIEERLRHVEARIAALERVKASLRRLTEAEAEVTGDRCGQGDNGAVRPALDGGRTG